MALDKSTLKKIGCFITSFMCVIGAIGGFGNCAYHGEWFTAVCIAVVAACAIPTVKKLVKYLIS